MGRGLRSPLYKTDGAEVTCAYVGGAAIALAQRRARPATSSLRSKLDWAERRGLQFHV